MARLPLVFACAGCSAAGRLAYDVALELQRREIAEMSCLAGVGAAKSHFLKQLKDREVWVIDGCPIECAVGVFGQQSRQVNVRIQLHDAGVKKSSGAPAGMKMEHLIEPVLQQARVQTALAAQQVHNDESAATVDSPQKPAAIAGISAEAAPVAPMT